MKKKGRKPLGFKNNQIEKEAILMNDENDMDIVFANAMQIIMFSGDARESCKLALDAISEQDLKKATEMLEDAEKKMVKAHHIQTDAIQGAIRGEKQDYNLLFAHAQDTLMAVYSEIHLTKQLIKIFSSLDKRFSDLEKKY